MSDDAVKKDDVVKAVITYKFIGYLVPLVLTFLIFCVCCSIFFTA